MDRTYQIGIKRILPRCPFCGEENCWKTNSASLFSRFFKFRYYETSVCCACGATIESEIHMATRRSPKTLNSFLIINPGSVNKYSLIKNKRYNPFVLEELSHGTCENINDINGGIEDAIIQRLAERRQFRQEEFMAKYNKDPSFRCRTKLSALFGLILCAAVLVGGYFLLKFMLSLI